MYIPGFKQINPTHHVGNFSNDSMWTNPAVLVAIITAISTIVVAVIKKAKGFPELKRRRKWSSRYNDIHETYEKLADIVTETQAKRATIIKCENGGGVPRPGHPLYISVIYEIVQGGVKPNREDWVKREMFDPSFFKFLSTLLNKRKYTLITEELPEDSLIKIAYEGYKVHHSETFLLKQSKGATYYLSVHYEAKEQLNADGKNILEARASDIRNIFQK